MSVHLPVSAGGCQTGAEEYQNSPSVDTRPSVTHSLTLTHRHTP